MLVVFFITLMAFLLVDSLKNQEFPVHSRTSSPSSNYVKPVSFGHHLLLAAIIYMVNFGLRKVLAAMSSRERH